MVNYSPYNPYGAVPYMMGPPVNFLAQPPIWMVPLRPSAQLGLQAFNPPAAIMAPSDVSDSTPRNSSVTYVPNHNDVIICGQGHGNASFLEFIRKIVVDKDVFMDEFSKNAILSSIIRKWMIFGGRFLSPHVDDNGRRCFLIINDGMTPQIYVRRLYNEQLMKLLSGKSPVVVTPPLERTCHTPADEDRDFAMNQNPDVVNQGLLGQVPEAEPPMNPNAITLYTPEDDQCLSQYLCLLRKQIELFEARRIDVIDNLERREQDKPIMLGQVGIRCLHCSMIHPKRRTRGATSYPCKFNQIYRAAMNIASAHLCEHCPHVPEPLRCQLLILRKQSSPAGEDYWAGAIKSLGVVEDAEQGILHFKKDSLRTGRVNQEETKIDEAEPTITAEPNAEGSDSVSSRNQDSPSSIENPSTRKGKICAMSVPDLFALQGRDGASQMPGCSPPECDSFVTESSSPVTLEEECQGEESISQPERDSAQKPQQEDLSRRHISLEFASDNVREDSDAASCGNDSDQVSSVNSLPFENCHPVSEKASHLKQSHHVGSHLKKISVPDKVDKKGVASLQAPQEESRPTRRSNKMRPNLLLLRLACLSRQTKLPTNINERPLDQSEQDIQSLASDSDCSQDFNDGCPSNESVEAQVSHQEDDDEAKSSTQNSRVNKVSVRQGGFDDEDLPLGEKYVATPPPLPLQEQKNTSVVQQQKNTSVPNPQKSESRDWTATEDTILREKRVLVGLTWDETAKFLAGRTGTACSDRFLYLSQKQKSVPMMSLASSTLKKGEDLLGSKCKSDSRVNNQVSSDWTEEEDNALREKRAIITPHTYKEIVYPRTKKSVSSRTNKLNISWKENSPAPKTRQEESFTGPGGDSDLAFAKSSSPRGKRALGGLTWDKIVSNSQPKKPRRSILQLKRMSNDDNASIAANRPKMGSPAMGGVGVTATEPTTFSEKRQETSLLAKQTIGSNGNGKVPSVKKRVPLDWTYEEDRIIKELSTSVPRLSDKEIALRLHPRTEGAVSGRISKLKISRPVRQKKAIAHKTPPAESNVEHVTKESDFILANDSIRVPRVKGALGGLSWNDLVSNSLPKERRRARDKSTRTIDIDADNMAAKSNQKPKISRSEGRQRKKGIAKASGHSRQKIVAPSSRARDLNRKPASKRIVRTTAKIKNAKGSENNRLYILSSSGSTARSGSLRQQLLGEQNVSVKAMPWTASQDDVLFKMKANNTSWREIAACLPGRTAAACRMHYSDKRKKSPKRKRGDFANKSVNGTTNGSKATNACNETSQQAPSTKDAKTGAASRRHRKKKRTDRPPRWTEQDRRLVQASYLTSCPRWHV